MNPRFNIFIASFLFFAYLPFTSSYGQLAKKIQNPILPGFNPDPCIVRVVNDYYIVTSTFEWFPGIPIYHSSDLSNWTQLGHVLTRKSQLDITGCSDSNGVFAPSITYHNGLFYVMYTVVREGINWSLKGYPNYIVTAKDPEGPWSEPVLINSLGFDPSLFIDDNGKAYVLLRIFDHRAEKNSSPGIGMHELDLETLKPIGEMKFIYSGWAKRSAEGPKMIKKDGYYYLFTAEGGTGYGHYEAVARSKNIWGEYERAPKILYSSKDNPKAEIQKAGHGTLFMTPAGEWYTTHLGSRPLSTKGNCPLGRETFLQKIKWNKEEWPELYDGGIEPQMKVQPPAGNPIVEKSEKQYSDDFENMQLASMYQFLREPSDESWLRLDMKKGYLSLRGQHALGTLYGQSLVAQRVTAYNQIFETCMQFNPTDFRHSAGITCYYNSKHFYYFALTYDERMGLVLEVAEADKKYKELQKEKVHFPPDSAIYLRAEIRNYALIFSYSLDSITWSEIGKYDLGKVSDDYANGFTGAMIGLFVQDILYSNQWAHFDFFKVRIP